MTLVTDKAMVTVISKAGASQRTKNRIRENGPHFYVRDQCVGFLFPFAGRKIVLLESAWKVGDAWLGWLPLDEIEMFEEIDLSSQGF